MGMLSLECPASPFLLEESSRLAPFLEPEAAAGAGFRRKCLVFNVRASDARLDGGTSRNGKNRTRSVNPVSLTSMDWPDRPSEKAKFGPILTHCLGPIPTCEP
jgi:hypothetical protein